MNKVEQHHNDQQESAEIHDIPTEDSPRISTRATQLAMELSKEKKRLTEELSTLQAEYENLAPATPTGGVDWYVKWIAMLFAVFGIFLSNADFFLAGQICYFIGSIGWTVVGMIWNDRAIMLGSVIPAVSVGQNLVKQLAVLF